MQAALTHTDGPVLLSHTQGTASAIFTPSPHNRILLVSALQPPAMALAYLSAFDTGPRGTAEDSNNPCSNCRPPGNFYC